MRKKQASRMVYLPPDLDKRLVSYASAKGVSMSSVVEAALKQYLDGVSDVTLFLRRLDRLGRSTERVHRDLSVLMEAFSVYAQLWFASTPQVPESEQEAAKRQAAARFRRFVEFVAQQIAGGHRFVDDLVKDQPLAAAAPDAAAVETRGQEPRATGTEGP